MQIFLSDIDKRNVVGVVVLVHVYRSLILFHPSLSVVNFRVPVVLPVLACVPPSPSTSVPSCSQVPSSPAAIKLNWLKRRDKDTLLPIIRAHILPGTRVMSDKWKAYDCLQDKGYQHLTVNHSLNFVDPDTGAHTQGIENTWWGVSEICPVQKNPRCLRKLAT